MRKALPRPVYWNKGVISYTFSGNISSFPVTLKLSSSALSRPMICTRVGSSKRWDSSSNEYPFVSGKQKYIIIVCKKALAHCLSMPKVIPGIEWMDYLLREQAFRGRKCSSRTQYYLAQSGSRIGWPSEQPEKLQSAKPLRKLSITVSNDSSDGKIERSLTPTRSNPKWQDLRRVAIQ